MNNTPTIVQETITPDIARTYLEMNRDNRPVRANHVRLITETLQQGQWHLTHQGIAFDITNRLVDGQHRLLAIAQSGVACSMLVTRGLPEDIYRYIDAGKTRSLSDRIHLVDDGGYRLNERTVSFMRAYVLAALGKSPPLPELIEASFNEMADAVRMVADEFRTPQKYLTIAPVGAALSCYASVHMDNANEFILALLSGSNLDVGSPILALREVALNRRLGHSQRPHEAYWKTISATIAFEEGRSMSRVQSASRDWRDNTPKRLTEARAARARQGHQTRLRVS